MFTLMDLFKMSAQLIFFLNGLLLAVLLCGMLCCLFFSMVEIFLSGKYIAVVAGALWTKEKV